MAHQTVDTGFDRGYWISHSEGFQVLIGKRRLGFVQDVVDGGRTLVVRGGLLGRRMLYIPVGEVFAIVPRDLRIWLSTSPTARASRAYTPSVLTDLSPAAAHLGRGRREQIAA